jgi:T5SS/PEP-CTERM-associated repeat protein
LHIPTDKVTFNTNGFTLTSSHIAIAREWDESAKVTITGGGTVLSDTIFLGLGEYQGSRSELTLTGPGTTMRLSEGNVRAGDTLGVGILTVSNGAVLESSAALSPSNTSALLGQRPTGRGEATVTGSGSRWNQDGKMSVGFNSEGILTIADGGVVQSAAGNIGRTVTANGRATITGAGARWIMSGRLDVGGDVTGSGGSALLSVRKGGNVTASAIQVWPGGTVTGDAATLSGNTTNHGTIAPEFSEVVDVFGANAIANSGFESPVASAGDVNNAPGPPWVGFNSADVRYTSRASAHSGLQSLKLFGPFDLVGNATGGRQIVAAEENTEYRAGVFARSNSTDQLQANNYGVFRLEFLDQNMQLVAGNNQPAGVSQVGFNLFESNRFDNSLSPNTWYELETGGVSPLGTSFIRASIRHIQGGNVGGGFAGGSVFFDDAYVKTFSSEHVVHAGILSILGNYVQADSGVLDITIEGMNGPGVADGHDKLIVSGTASLGGTLKVTLRDGFTVSTGNSFDVLDFASSSGAFTAFDLPDLSGGLVWNVSNLALTGVLSVVASTTFPGDFSGDGKVDAADYVVWRKSVGRTVTPGTGADGSGNGVITQADYEIWRTRFGSGGATALDSSVPEPATVVPGVLFALGAVLRRRRRPSLR